MESICCNSEQFSIEYQINHQHCLAFFFFFFTILSLASFTQSLLQETKTIISFPALSARLYIICFDVSLFQIVVLLTVLSICFNSFGFCRFFDTQLKISLLFQ